MTRDRSDVGMSRVPISTTTSELKRNCNRKTSLSAKKLTRHRNETRGIGAEMNLTSALQSEKKLVDVTGFEPATPCLQSMEMGFRNPFHFSIQKKIKILKLPDGMCLDVRRCGYLFAGSLQKSLHSSTIEKGAQT